MNVLTVLVLHLIISSFPSDGQGLFPSVDFGFNLAEDRPVVATSVCNTCNSSLINDGDQGTSWQSATGVSDVNVTINLQGERRIIYVSMRFQSAIPYGIGVYYSTDGCTFSPRQYFARDCSIFDLSANSALQSISDVNCITKSVFQYPFKNQLVEFLLVGSGTRPNADTIFQLNLQPELQQFAQASHVRIQLIGWHSEQAAVDQYFAITELVLTGQSCICNGHASSCNDNECICQHNTAGDMCSQCLPLYNDQEWQMGTVNFANPCIECECNNHSGSCYYNKTLSRGVCIDCQRQTRGYSCEECLPFYYHPSSVSIDSFDRCRPCDCNESGITDNGDCMRGDIPDSIGTDSGNCSCKPNVGGRDCSFCLDGYYDLSNTDGCISCDCNATGSASVDVCDKVTGQCDCLEGVDGRDCSRCAQGFYGFGSEGCQGCHEECVDCYGESAEECTVSRLVVYIVNGFKLHVLFFFLFFFFLSVEMCELSFI